MVPSIDASPGRSTGMIGRPDVVIPVKNCENTIMHICRVVLDCHWINKLILVIDGTCADSTAWDASTFYNYSDRFHMVDLTNSMGEGGPGITGKGQVVKRGLDHVTSERVIFLDGDTYGLTTRHIAILSEDNPYPDMIIGVPDFPQDDDLTELPRPFTRTGIMRSWPLVSGHRSVPTALARSLDLHGYLMEVQINQAAQAANLTVDFRCLKGLVSPLRLTETRIQAMEDDRKWGEHHGFLPA